ncbi:MAG: radical SAM protein, partial [Clostridiales bacterium]|nr:radical SAM protein [Clostridiales bacterium]
LSGTRGSGTIFFTGCPLGCVFCQNYEISRRLPEGSSHPGPYELPGRIYTIEGLASAMLDLQNQGAHNINFVTGTHYVPHIIEGVRLARAHGLTIPTLYNCGGYESVDTIRSLEGTIDIYLPDMKFFSREISSKYAHAADYFDRAKDAIDEMVRQCPKQEFDKDGMMKRGVIVRHLMLPGVLFDTKHILDYLTETYGNTITISLMNQYTPMPGAPDELARPLPQKHYDSMVNYLSILGQTNAFTQEGGTVSESFIPDFE